MRPDKRFTIVMATLNSERTIEKSLRALRGQHYPQDLIEVLVIDGGSKDQTRAIATQYGCRVIDNPKVDPVSAKLIGVREATGDYLVYLDSDEEFVSPQALTKRYRALSENPHVHLVFASGYQNPPDANFISRFINEYGDPFSMFNYRLSKDHRFFFQELRHLCDPLRETEAYRVYGARSTGRQPILENGAQANAMDLKFFRQKFPELIGHPAGPQHFYYLMQKHTREFAVTLNDPLIHHSSERWGNYLRKIRWRIINNLFYVNEIGVSGFAGRNEFDRGLAKWRKYLFLPYAFLLVPLILDTLRYIWTRKDPEYVLLIPLVLYTAISIVYFGVLKLLGLKPQRTAYGSSQAVASR